jgi:nucleotide-binding universal stress UspA family protein
MVIKDILVHADSTDTFETRLKYALELGRKNDAHLTALYVIPKYPIPAYAGVSIDPAIFQAVRDNERQTAETAKTKFESISANQDCKVEWRVEEGDPTHYLNLHGRYFDFVVLGQPDPKWNSDGFTEVTDNLVISLGRPCLVVPYIGTAPKTPKRILVAWNGSHSSARAVNDALPLLETADLVEVMSINSDKSSFDEGDIPSADICLHLARHGVKAEAKSTFSSEISDENLILTHASDMAADLLVMGAYGHSRFRELILGGVTRHLLRHMTIPVFMSH